MAAVALRAVFTQVAVILVMAAAAQGRSLHRARRLMMAIGALPLGMSAEQWEVIGGLLRMIEHPQLPPVGGMTALAFLAEPALVHIVVRMAIVARHGHLVEGQGRVALRAAHDPMQSEQREIREVVIEDDVGAPFLLAMAGFAPTLELAAV